VDRTGRGRPEGRAVGVVAHGVALGVVPQRGNGVSVVVVHDVAGHAGAALGRPARPVADRLWEAVHCATVEGPLLVVVVVVLVARQDVVDVGRVITPRVDTVRVR